MPGRLLDSPALHQKPRRFAVDLPAIGIELQATADFGFRAFEISLLCDMAGTNAVWRGKGRIELECFFGRRQPVIDVPAVMISQAGLGDREKAPRLGIVGVQAYGPLRGPNDNLVP
jgi:hypothetical protein